MNDSSPLPSLDALKQQAKRLRAALGGPETGDGPGIGHGKALELVAQLHGYQDWNTLYAALGNRPPVSPVALGARVSGHYLGQAFEGEVLGVQMLTPPGRYRITLGFDAPVDVVTFPSFSNFRSRMSCVIDGAGATAEKTSDGRPQLQLRL